MGGSTVKYFVAPIITSLIIGMVSYFYLTDRKPDPRSGVVLTSLSYEIPVSSFLAIFLKAIDFPREKIPDATGKVLDFLNYSDTLYVEKYKIDNKSDTKIENIDVVPLEDNLIRVVNGETHNEISNDGIRNKLIILPGDYRYVYVYYSRWSMDLRVKFLIDGKALQLTETKFANNINGVEDSQGFLSFFLGLSCFIFWSLIIIISILAFLFKNSPKFFLNSTTSETIGTYIALANYLRIENPPKYKRSVKAAEKQYEMWINNSKTSVSSFDN